MNRLIEGIKDILHDSLDVVLVIVIFLAVGGTILWRLDILFANDMGKQAINQPSDNNLASNDHSNPVDTPSNTDDTPSPTPDDSPDQNPGGSEVPDNSEDGGNKNNNSDGTNNTNEDTNDNEVVNDEPVIVIIPSGSLAPKIGQIVQELGLIEPEEYGTFLLRAQEMNLDTKFQSGTFKIAKDAPLDIIIKTIARAL